MLAILREEEPLFRFSDTEKHPRFAQANVQIASAANPLGKWIAVERLLPHIVLVGVPREHPELNNTGVYVQKALQGQPVLPAALGRFITRTANRMRWVSDAEQCEVQSDGTLKPCQQRDVEGIAFWGNIFFNGNDVSSVGCAKRTVCGWGWEWRYQNFDDNGGWSDHLVSAVLSEKGLGLLRNA